ncbi:MAG: hypothetical protein QM490_02495 [Candidatus Gracilibacteria bacterium]
MKTLYFFGYTLNGLEYVTYVIIPIAIILMIILFIGSNFKLIFILTNTDNDEFEKFNYILDSKKPGTKIKLEGLKKKAEKEKV